MTFDTTTILIIVALVAAAILIFALARSRRAAPVERKKPEGEPYVASKERPYVKAKAREDGPQGNSIADSYASATTDVAGDVLGVEAHGQLPGAAGAPDDLQALKGVGPKFAARLNELGIIRYDQIAALSDNEVAILDGKLGPFKGRMTRDRVVEQAGYLARGDTDGFEDRFGKLGG
jgi:predicted flap endonuclease-1-like 5' DNA nuclease